MNEPRPRCQSAVAVGANQLQAVDGIVTDFANDKVLVFSDAPNMWTGMSEHLYSLDELPRFVRELYLTSYHDQERLTVVADVLDVQVVQDASSEVYSAVRRLILDASLLNIAFVLCTDSDGTFSRPIFRRSFDIICE